LDSLRISGDTPVSACSGPFVVGEICSGGSDLAVPARFVSILRQHFLTENVDVVYFSEEVGNVNIGSRQDDAAQGLKAYFGRRVTMTWNCTGITSSCSETSSWPESSACLQALTDLPALGLYE
jgi:hypothetical protein